MPLQQEPSKSKIARSLFRTRKTELLFRKAVTRQNETDSLTTMIFQNPRDLVLVIAERGDIYMREMLFLCQSVRNMRKLPKLFKWIKARVTSRSHWSTYSADQMPGVFLQNKFVRHYEGEEEEIKQNKVKKTDYQILIYLVVYLKHCLHCVFAKDDFTCYVGQSDLEE